MANICNWPSIGQFYGVSHRDNLKCGGTDIIIAIYGAYNARGLIGPEYNGIVILDNTDKKVLVDGHAPHPGGSGYYGPHPDTVREWARIIHMDPSELLLFIREHPRSRDKAYSFNAPLADDLVLVGGDEDADDHYVAYDEDDDS